MNEDYQFKGIPITAAITEHLITSYLQGKKLRRSEIIDSVEKIHIDNGGLPAEAADFSRTVKKALQNLKNKNLAENPSSGWWSIKQNDDIEDLSAQVSSDLGNKEEPGENDQEYKIEAVMGDGDEAVYVYYYPAYKASALAAGKDHWLCKIGRTDRLPRIRISEQITGMPEQPVIGLVIKTDDSRAVETVIKNVLSLRGQWSEDSPGIEWFITSPDNVAQIYKLLVP